MLSQVLITLSLSSWLSLSKWTPYEFASITMIFCLTSGLQLWSHSLSDWIINQSYDFLLWIAFFSGILSHYWKSSVSGNWLYYSAHYCDHVSGSKCFGTCLWKELGNCEETSSRKPRSSKQQRSTVDVMGVQVTGISYQ